jgi:hypothetical protein
MSSNRVRAGAKSLPLPEAAYLISYSPGPDEGSPRYAVPFYYDKRNSALDVRFVNGFTDNTEVGDSTSFWVRANLDNGHFLVNNLGSNFKTWYETAYDADSGSVSVYEPGVVAKANVVLVSQGPENGGVFSTEASTPISFESAAGAESNDYLATVLFKKGLVITYTKTVDDVTTRYYRGFTTIWSEGRD